MLYTNYTSLFLFLFSAKFPGKQLRFYFLCTLENTHGLSQKIQGTYFKISALYFKIYGLYFSPFQMPGKQCLEKLQK